MPITRKVLLHFLKKGKDIRYMPELDKEWKYCTVLSRAGKATGKYYSHFNVVDREGVVSELNLKEVQWEPVNRDTDNQAGTVENNFDKATTEEIYVTQSFQEQSKGDIMTAKICELQNWIEQEVYTEVEDAGQPSISVRWVITQS